MADREGQEVGAGTEPASPAPARTSLTVEERIDFIAGMMERLEWVRGKSAKQLAAQWGLAKDTVEGHAAEASRRIVGDKDEAIRDITAGARQLMRRMLDASDAKGFTSVANLLADVAGAKAPVKQEHKVAGVSLDDLSELKQSTGFDQCPSTESEPKS